MIYAGKMMWNFSKQIFKSFMLNKNYMLQGAVVMNPYSQQPLKLSNELLVLDVLDKDASTLYI